MKHCIECGSRVDWNPRSSLCEQCFDDMMQKRIENIDIDSSENEWF